MIRHRHSPRRVLACALALFGILGAAPAPPAASPPSDQVNALAGTWACRTVEGVLVRQSGTRAGNTIVVRDDVQRNGKLSVYEDRYVFDPALDRWHVETGLGGFSGAASPWTGSSWIVQGRNADDVAVRMTDELLPGGDLRRTFAYQNGTGWFPYSVERCTRGDTPPGADACIAQNYPATTLEAATVKPWNVPPMAPSGRVLVVVSLDEHSRITGARVIKSPSPELNAAALQATRESRFRTEIRDCKPLAADFIFSVDF